MNPILAQIQTLLAQLGFPTAGTTNVPQLQWSSTGLVVPSQAAVVAGVLLDWNTAGGGNINPAYTTPQGQMVMATAAAISNCYALIALMVNGMDPDMNYGFMQDVIGRIYFLNRSAGTPTVVSCVVNGLNGASVPSNVPIAEDTTTGAQYICQVSGASIPVSGNVTLTFANTVNGPVACAAGSIKLIQAIPGIDSITNPSNGVPGTLVESSEAFEFQREQSVASNSQGSADAILGVVTQVPGVTDCFVFENSANTSVLAGSTKVSVVANSVFVAVIGGSQNAIAQAIWTKKDLGCNMNGNTSVTVLDTNYATPPTYTIKFNDNTTKPVVFNLTVNIKNSPLLPTTIVADAQAAAQDAFIGTLPVAVQNYVNTLSPPAAAAFLQTLNIQRVRIASLFTPVSSIAPAVSLCEGPSIPVQVISIFIGSAFSGQGTTVNGSNVLTITTSITGTLTAGTPLTDANSAIPAGTYIVQQLTGTPGGNGTYQMSANATITEVSPETITGTATGTAALIGIDQAPVLGPVTVNLI